jgi:GrpB-like predicted nucleotidyltransferase (UPF0157 family)
VPKASRSAWLTSLLVEARLSSQNALFVAQDHPCWPWGDLQHRATAVGKAEPVGSVECSAGDAGGGDPTDVAAYDQGLPKRWVGQPPPLQGRIQIRDYDPQWPRLYRREAARIRSTLGERVALLEHAGSTSVPGLPAKPNINLHVFSAGCLEVDRMLRFRDWLRVNPADRDRYALAKRELAAREWKYVQQYADAKTTVVQEIMARAEAGRG